MKGGHTHKYQELGFQEHVLGGDTVYPIVTSEHPQRIQILIRGLVPTGLREAGGRSLLYTLVSSSVKWAQNRLPSGTVHVVLQLPVGPTRSSREEKATGLLYDM